MPFLQVNVEQEIQKQRENDPEFKKIWDESRAEYRLIGEMISILDALGYELQIVKKKSV